MNAGTRLLLIALTVTGLSLVVAPATVADGGLKTPKPTGTKQKTVEMEIWDLEQAYWEYNRDADHKRIVASWHDKFLGWPDAEPKPIDKEQGARYARKNYAKLLRIPSKSSRRASRSWETWP